MNRQGIGVLSVVVFGVLVFGSVRQGEPTIFLWALLALAGMFLLLWAYPAEWPKGRYGNAWPLYNWRGVAMLVAQLMTGLGLANALLVWSRGYANWGTTWITVGLWVALYAFGFLLHKLDKRK